MRPADPDRPTAIIRTPKASVRRRAIAAGMILGAAVVAPSVPAGAVDPVAAWPSTWTPYTYADGSPVVDPQGDENPGYADLWSGVTGTEGGLPTVYFDSDGTTAFFRLRVEGDPEANKGGEFNSTVWLVQIGVAGVPVASVGVDGKPAGVNDYVYATNTDESLFTVTSSPVVPDGSQAGGARVVTDEAGGYFVDFQLPVDAVTAVSPDLDPSTPVQLFFGSSTNNSNINKDYMTGGEVSFVGLAEVALDGSAVVEPEPEPTSPPAPTTTEPPVTTSTTTEPPVTTTTTEPDPAPEAAIEPERTAIRIDITSDAVTADPTPVIAGDGSPGAAVEVTVDDQVLVTTIDAGGSWAVEVGEPLDDGIYDVVATATDESSDPASATATLTVDTISEAKVDPMPGGAGPISGTGEPGGTVTVRVDDVLTDSVTVADDGTWTTSVLGDLDAGIYDVVVTMTDLLGNEASTTFAVEITAPAPAALDASRSDTAAPAETGATRAAPDVAAAAGLTGAGAAGSLAATGTASGMLALVAFALLAIGSIVLVAGDRLARRVGGRRSTP